jgi:hypothetical protein
MQNGSATLYRDFRGRRSLHVVPALAPVVAVAAGAAPRQEGGGGIYIFL